MAPTTATWPAQLAAQPTRRSPVAFLLAPVGEGACPTRAATRRGHLLPPCLPGSASTRLDDATRPPEPSGSPSVSPERSPPPLFFPPNASVAAARHHRGHRHPGDALRCPRAPPSIPLPPRRAVQRRTPPSASTSSSSTSQCRRSLSPPRSLQCFPEHAEATSALTVSPCVEPPPLCSVCSL